MIAVAVFYLLILALTFIGMWHVYEKAGQAGWSCIIPIYGLLILRKRPKNSI